MSVRYRTLTIACGIMVYAVGHGDYPGGVRQPDQPAPSTLPVSMRLDQVGGPCWFARMTGILRRLCRRLARCRCLGAMGNTDQTHTVYVTARPVATKVAMRLNVGQKAQPGGRRAASSYLLEVR